MTDINTFIKEHNKSKEDIVGINGQLAENVKLTGISLKELNSTTNGLITFITDDGQYEDYSMALPIFTTAGVPCCTAIISDTIGDATKYRMTLEQILELQNNHGWEILSHTMHHIHLSQLSEAEQETELKGSIDQLNGLGLKCESIAYPFGYQDEMTRKIARKYYRSARTVDKGLYGINYPPIDTYALKMIYIDSSATYTNDESGYAVNTLDFYKYYIDKAYSTNGWLIITFHSGDIVNAGLTQVLSDVVNYAKTKCPILTFSQALNIYGNVTDIGDMLETNPTLKHHAVGYNGKTSTNNLDTVFMPTNQFGGNSMIDAFEDYKITINKVNDALGASGSLPEGVGGILTTYKLSSRVDSLQIYNYQVYQVLYSGNTYKRFCKSDKTWSGWICTNLQLDVINKYNCNNTITSMPIGITINRIDGATAVANNSPEGLGGVLITFKTSTGHGYSWQEYNIYTTNKCYRRYFNSDGTATAWVDMSPKLFIQLTTDIYNSNTTITSFPIGITQNRISTATASTTGSPENLGGVMITNKMHETLNSYNWQEYHIIGTVRVYKRSFADNGTPTAWTKISAV